MIDVVLITLGIACLALLALAIWISGLLLYARRQPVTRTPADAGLAYEEVIFQDRYGPRLHGWWIPAGSVPAREAPGRAAIVLHPMFGNRQGFSVEHQGWPRLFRTDVDLLGTMQGFHRAGYAVLAFDFRSHGESQGGLCAGGRTEDLDVACAVDYVFERLAAGRPEGEIPQVGLVGFGLGASAAIAAIGREKGSDEVVRFFSGDSEGGSGIVEYQPPNVKRLRFLVAIQPASLGVLVRGYLRQVWAPLSLVLAPLVDRLCQWRGGYPLDGAFLLKYAGEVHIPVLYVQARSDPWGGSTEVERLYAATPGPKQIWWLSELRGRQEAYGYVGDHLAEVLAFAAQHMPAAELALAPNPGKMETEEVR